MRAQELLLKTTMRRLTKSRLTVWRTHASSSRAQCGLVCIKRELGNWSHEFRKFSRLSVLWLIISHSNFCSGKLSAVVVWKMLTISHAYKWRDCLCTTSENCLSFQIISATMHRLHHHHHDQSMMAVYDPDHKFGNARMSTCDTTRASTCEYAWRMWWRVPRLKIETAYMYIRMFLHGHAIKYCSI